MNSPAKLNVFASLNSRRPYSFFFNMLKLALAAQIICAGVMSAEAATKTFTGPGNFSTAARWGGALPLVGDVLRINGICTNDNAAANLVYNTLEVGRASAGTLTWPVGGTNTLRVLGIVASTAGGTINMSNGGTLQIGASGWTTTGQTFVPGAGKIIWAETATATLPTAITTYNDLAIQVTAGTTTTLGTAITVNGDLTLTSGTLAASTFGIAVKGDWLDNGGAFTPNTGTVLLNGSTAQNIGGSSATSFNNLTVSNTSATVSASINFNVAGTMTLAAGATLSPAAAVVINTAAAAGTLTGAGTILVTRTAATADLVNQY